MSEHIEQQPDLTGNSTAATPIPDYETIQTEHYRAKYAGFWTRLWAYTIDLLVLSAISGIIIKPIFRVAGWEITNPSFFLFSTYKVTILILLLLYFALMTKYLQQTVGKMIMGIRVVAKDGGSLRGGLLFSVKSLEDSYRKCWSSLICWSYSCLKKKHCMTYSQIQLSNMSILMKKRCV